MNIKLNTEGTIISSKDKNYINDKIFIETEGKNSPFCYVITSDANSSGDEMCNISDLQKIFEEREWEIKWITLDKK